jgi:hypothetical protein
MPLYSPHVTDWRRRRTKAQSIYEGNPLYVQHAFRRRRFSGYVHLTSTCLSTGHVASSSGPMNAWYFACVLHPPSLPGLPDGRVDITSQHSWQRKNQFQVTYNSVYCLLHSRRCLIASNIEIKEHNCRRWCKFLGWINMTSTFFVLQSLHLHIRTNTNQ